MKKSSVIFSSAFVLLCMVSLTVLLFLLPAITAWYVNFRGMSQEVYTVLLAAFYTCAAPAMLALYCLLLLLAHIRREEMFTKPNSLLMAVSAWCALAVAAVMLIAAFWYMPLLLVSAAMLFIFLIVRVVRRCFIAATALKEENNLTI